MSKEVIQQHVQMLKKIGPWTGARYLRNQGVPFPVAKLMIRLLREN